jgi:membrane-associated protease RseP (regulator of RpoE activity)
LNNGLLIDEAKRIISNKMELDYFSRFAGTIIFRQDKDKISKSEIEEIQNKMISKGIYSQLQESKFDYLLRVLAEFPKVKPENRRINLLLFLTTIITTTMTGAINIWNNPFASWSDLFSGIPYAFGIIAILGSHEMGHYYYSLKYKIYATLPYFLPIWWPGFGFGTLGAFIKMKSPIPNKKALFDVGIAGPIAGFIVSLLFLILGFSLLPDDRDIIAYVETMHPWTETGEGSFTLGGSILFNFIKSIMGAEHLPMWEIYHFPYIFAGWIGLFVTALNLMPIGQLDGGHISYALFGKKARFIAIIAFIALALLNLYSANWLLWTVLIFFVIRLKHPPTMDDTLELDENRKILGYISYIIFITCFSPTPFYFS